MRYGLLFIAPLLGLIIVVAVTIWRYLKQKRKVSKRTKIVRLAHTQKVKELPEYIKARRLYIALLGSGGLVFMIAFISCTLLASRPISVTTTEARYDNRDIMLCLDVSGSMDSYQEAILEYFINSAEHLKGQRVGLTIFDNAYYTVMPLTDDYLAVRDVLSDVSKNFSEYASTLWDTELSGSSLVGDGTIGCVNAFDKLGDQERTRAIILTTDNYAGEGHATLMQAAKYAKRYGVTIYGINIADSRTDAEIDDERNGKRYTDYVSPREEFYDAVILTGGSYYPVLNPDVIVSAAPERIMQQEAAKYTGSIRTVRNDNPKRMAIWLAVSVIILLIIVWRLKL